MKRNYKETCTSTHEDYQEKYEMVYNKASLNNVLQPKFILYIYVCVCVCGCMCVCNTCVCQLNNWINVSLI